MMLISFFLMIAVLQGLISGSQTKPQATLSTTTTVTTEATTSITTEATAVNECSFPWFSLGKQCFLRVTERRTWDEALKYCFAQAPDVSLAQPSNITALNDYLKDNEDVAFPHWLGGSDLMREGTWVWIIGNNDITSGWQDGQPDNDQLQPKDSNGQDCLTIFVKRGDNSLADTNCGDSWYFLCERLEDINNSFVTGYPLAPTQNPISSSAPGECPSPWFRLGHQCFRVMTPQSGVNWTTARTLCDAEFPGADLAQPNSVHDLFNYMVQNGMDGGYEGDLYWLGGSDLATEGEWLWLNGSPITNGWNENQPNNLHGNQDCLSMNVWHQNWGYSSLGDIDCSLGIRFFCERR